MIKPISFIELSAFTAHYIVKYKERMVRASCRCATWTR